MNFKSKNLLLTFIRIKWLKYVAVVAIASVIIGYADENSLYNHLRNKRTISMIESEIADLKAQHIREKNLLKQMDRDVRAVEKIARERYFMKHADEDIFVLSTDLDNKPVVDDETAE